MKLSSAPQRTFTTLFRSPDLHICCSVVQSHCSHQTGFLQQQAAVFSERKITQCTLCAPHSRNSQRLAYGKNGSKLPDIFSGVGGIHKVFAYFIVKFQRSSAEILPRTCQKDSHLSSSVCFLMRNIKVSRPKCI